MEKRYYIYLAGGILFIVIALFAYEWATDGISSWLYNRGEQQTTAKEIELKKQVDELLLETQIDKAQIDEQKKVLEKVDEAKDAKAAEELAEEAESLEEKFKEIRETPPDEQLSKLCAETKLVLDMCKGVGVKR